MARMGRDPGFWGGCLVSVGAGTEASAPRGASPNAGRGAGSLAFRQKSPRHPARASRWFPRRNGPDGGKYEVEHSVQRTSCLSFPSVPPLRGGRAAFPPRTRPLLKPLYSARTLCTPPRTIRKDLSAVTWKRRVNRPRLPWRSMGPGVDQGNGTQIGRASCRERVSPRV